jgi:hypothetical protein
MIFENTKIIRLLLCAISIVPDFLNMAGYQLQLEIMIVHKVPHNKTMP